MSVTADHSGGRRAATKAANRAAIVDAAREVFGELGFGGASVRDVIRRTDLASGTFYNYFPDKEALFRAVLEETAETVRARVQTARRQAGSLEEFVAAGFREYFSFLADDPQAFALMRRNSGTIRAMFDEPIFGAGIDELVPGLKATADAERLAAELAFAAARLEEFDDDPPGLYADIVTMDDVEEALWLAFLVAFICPLEDAPDPFANIREAHVPWTSGELPRLDVARGPRAQANPVGGERTVLAYRAWTERSGSQQAAFGGEQGWTAQRRFDRVFERLSLPGLDRPARYELLVSLGRLDLVELRPTSLRLTDDATTLAAKRVFGIADTVLLDRRARTLADAVEVPIEALDLALSNWGAQPGAQRATYGSRAEVADGDRDAIAAVLGT